MFIVAAPDNKVQLPVPTIGEFPESVAVVAQIVCVKPAFDAVGLISRTIATVEIDGGQIPLEIVH